MRERERERERERDVISIYNTQINIAVEREVLFGH